MVDRVSPVAHDRARLPQPRRRTSKTLHHNLRDCDRIVVPLPVHDYTTDVVLTMDFVDGRNLSSMGPLGLMDVDGPPLAAALFSAYLQQILIDGFFHADPHPGNVLVTPDGRLALLDLGMVARIAPDMQRQPHQVAAGGERRRRTARRRRRDHHRSTDRGLRPRRASDAPPPTSSVATKA